MRKKKNQISFLHLYHHTSMVLTVFLYIKLHNGGGYLAITSKNENFIQSKADKNLFQRFSTARCMSWCLDIISSLRTNPSWKTCCGGKNTSRSCSCSNSSPNWFTWATFCFSATATIRFRICALESFKLYGWQRFSPTFTINLTLRKSFKPFLCITMLFHDLLN